MKDVLNGAPWCVVQGDSADLLRELPDASVDAVVTDPPAGISFMGRSWDGDHGGRDNWVKAFTALYKECLRALKPGGHAIVWALPRTSHWTATALEDAGFEVRDIIHHHFGSGFPKSLDVSKAIDKRRQDSTDAIAACLWIREAVGRSGFTHYEIAARIGVVESMVRHWMAKTGNQHLVPTTEQWAKLEPLLGSPPDWMRSLILPANQPGDAWFERDVVGEGVSGETAIWADGGMGNFDITVPATEAAKQWDGWGTSLKPSTENWILCRKPLIGTVAENVLAHGTGALNIAATRVGYRDAADKVSATPQGECTAKPGALAGKTQHIDGRQVFDRPELIGRWPANLVLSHHPDCVRTGTKRVRGSDRLGHGDKETHSDGVTGWNAGQMHSETRHADPDGKETVEAWQCVEGCPVAELDRQSGEQITGNTGGGIAYRRTESPAIRAGGGMNVIGNAHERQFYPGSGGASRFFYCAKPSRAERNAGLKDFPVRVSDERTAAGQGMYAEQGGTIVPGQNHHPTVKAIQLMRWLCRLVTPPGGVVLDPFAGSGSTGCAAIAEGFRFIGFERDEDYVSIARARIAHAERMELEKPLDLFAMSLNEED